MLLSSNRLFLKHPPLLQCRKTSIVAEDVSAYLQVSFHLTICLLAHASYPPPSHEWVLTARHRPAAFTGPASPPSWSQQLRCSQWLAPCLVVAGAGEL